MLGVKDSTLWRDLRGNVSITTALVGTLLLTAVGASMDGGRMITTKMQLQSISDAAALMAATPERASDADRRSLALNSINSHLERRGDIVLNSQDVMVRQSGREVEVELSADVPLLFGAFLGGSKRSVRVSSTAEEIETGGLNAVSISVVLDLSDSMSERFDTGSRLAAVRAAVSDTFASITSRYGAAADTQISTGLYPFNWGMVDGEVVALEPGTTTVIDELNFATLRQGSVAAEAMEAALQDQLNAMANEGDRDRYIVLMTDGASDIELADAYRTYLPESQIFDRDGTPACTTATAEFEQAKDQLNATFNYMYTRGNSATLYPHGPAHRAMFTDSEADTEAHGRVVADMIISNGCYSNCRRIGRDFTNFLDTQSQRNLVCRPSQIQRVVEACEEARDNNISILAVDLGAEDWATQDMLDLCVNPDTVSDRASEDRATRNFTRPDPLGRDLSEPTERMPSGLTVQLSVDGKSMSATVDNLRDLREVLATMLPEASQQGERTVRLVG